jgi:competence protein CoiA
MKFALIDGNRTEAIKGAKGICPHCSSEVIAKCGKFKIHHWAHKGIRNCDPWCENETEWHRSWKNNYSADWLEISLRDKVSNETHIADVRTNAGLVIEFQHSNIHPDERIAREAFYKNMVWVVDGTRLKNDYPRFRKGIHKFYNTDDPRIFHFDAQDEHFPSAWLGSSVPVIFDFRGSETIDDPEDPRNYLYCLQPKINGKYPFFAKLSRQDFIACTITGEWSSLVKSYFDRPNKYHQLQQQGMQNSRVRREPPYVFDRGRFIKRRRF